MFSQNSSYSTALVIGLLVAAMAAFVALAHALSQTSAFG